MMLNFQVFLTTFIAMSMLALSMRRHAGVIPERLGQIIFFRRMMALGGWLGLFISLYMSVTGFNIGNGLVLWFGLVTLAALVTAVFLNYLPQHFNKTLVISLLTSLALVSIV